MNRRSFLQLTGSAAALAVAAACTPSGGGAPGGGAAPAAKTAAKGTTIASLGRDYLAYPDVKGTVQFSNCWGAARIPLIETWIKDFTAIYPNVKVESDLADCSPLREKQVTAIASGSPPNTLMIKSDNTAFFAEQGAILPIDDLMARDNVKREWYYPGEFSSRTWQGKAYGLPNVTAGALHMLWLNNGLLEKIGVDPKKKFDTWQDLDALVEPAKKAGLMVMDPAHISTGMTSHQVFTYANGGKYWTDDLTKITWNDAYGVEAAEWLLNFVKAQAGKYESLAIASDRKNVLQPEDWKPQKYVSMINGSWTFFQLKQKAPEINYSTYLIPRNAKNPASKGQTPSTGGWMFSLAKAGKDQDAAWEWIKFTTTSQHACTFVQKQSRPSPVVACNEAPELAKENPFWPIVTQDLANGVAVPTTTIHPQLEQLWYDMEDAILYEKMKPKEALDSAAVKGQALLDEWNSKRKKS